MNLVLEGEADLAARRSTHRVRPGWIVLSDAGELRAVTRRLSPAAETRSVTFSSERLAHAFAERGRRATAPLHFRENATTSPELFSALRRFYMCLDQREESLGVGEALESVVDALVPQIEMQQDAKWSGHPAVRRARERLHDEVDGNVALETLAADVGLTRAHFIRAFRRELGVPPHAYLVQLRVARARALLAAGVPVAEASAAVGFFDQSHLTRHFRRLLGITPAAYGRAVRT